MSEHDGECHIPRGYITERDSAADAGFARRLPDPVQTFLDRLERTDLSPRVQEVVDSLRTRWVCDGCMRRLTREQVSDMVDGEHVLCFDCDQPDAP